MRKIFFLLVIVISHSLIFAQGSGNTLSFNGVGQSINIGNIVANNCRTIEMWFKPDINITSSNSSTISLLVRDYNNGDGASINEFGLFFSKTSWGNAGKLAFGRRIGSTQYIIYSNSNNWLANHWYHVAVTIDPISGMKMYINGEVQQQTNSSIASIGTQSTSSYDDVYIGRWGYYNGRYFNGQIDEVRIWETARTQTEIRQKMCSKLQSNTSGLKAYYNFDSQSNSLLIDNSLNTYNGSLLNFLSTSRIYSGAPIGDTSTYLYNSLGLGAQNLSLVSLVNDVFNVNSINSTAKGIHIYQVNSIPNSLLNINNSVLNDYYGVFLTDRSGTFSVNYDFSGSQCNCPLIYTRNDNSILGWTNINVLNNMCSFQINNQSTVANDYRAEYIVENSISPFDLGNDTSMCTGQSLLLDVYSANATYLWQDGSTSSTYLITQTGLYWVQISNNACVFSDTINVVFNPSPIIDLGNDTVLCTGETIILNALYPNATYLWQDGSTDSILTVNSAGLYWVIVNLNNCIFSDSILITYYSPPTVDLGNDTIICEGSKLILDVSANNILSYLWQDNSTKSFYSISRSGNYWVIVSNQCGFDSSYISIQTKDCNCYVYIPNAFTPNFDGLNDEFFVQSNCDFQSYKLTIFNRWGELIFMSNDPMEKWKGVYKNGKCQNGVYIYVLDYIGASGINEIIRGHINLIQ